MKISGFEKLTLTDYPEHLACIIFTQGCNYRCPFCQNSSLINIRDGDIDIINIMNYLEERKNILEGVVISGGEPTVQPDLYDFIKLLRTKGLKIKLDTNGSNPMILKKLLDENLLDYVAMDIKNDFESYDKIIGTHACIDKLKESINLLKNSNIYFEFRTTIVKEFHYINKLKNIAKIVGNHKYFIQNYQDSDYVLDRSLHGFTQDELAEIANEFKKNKNIKVRGM